MEDAIKRYIGVVRRDEKGCAYVAHKVRQFGDFVKFEDHAAIVDKKNKDLFRLHEAQKAERFLGYLAEECEGNIITEEYLISTMDDFLKKEASGE